MQAAWSWLLGSLGMGEVTVCQEGGEEVGDLEAEGIAGKKAEEFVD